MHTISQAHTETEFARNPVLFVDLARRWAAGGPAPEDFHECWLKEMTRPFLHNPTEAREALWGVLSFPERVRGLGWLNKMGLLQELLPCWSGDKERRDRRLQSVEELHLERWAKGMTAEAMTAVNSFMDKRLDGGLNRWALTGLSCLLLTGDDPANEHCLAVERDLTALGASPDEVLTVVATCRDYPDTYELLVRSSAAGRLNLVAIIACLSSLFAYPSLADETRVEAIRRADIWIRGQS